jgi:protein SCO1
MMLRRIVPFLVLGFSLVITGAALFLSLRPAVEATPAVTIGGPFRLVNHEGRAVTEKDMVGAPFLVFFGFTHCPDICPTKLFETSEILRATGERGKNLKALFVSVDPERDTPEILKNYLGSFDPRIQGLTGDRTAVEAMMKTYRAIARKIPTSSDYTMDHTSLVYLMDRNGRFLRSFSLDRKPEDAARELLNLL